jgi:hypothetical protein
MKTIKAVLLEIVTLVAIAFNTWAHIVLFEAQDNDHLARILIFSAGAEVLMFRLFLRLHRESKQNHKPVTSPKELTPPNGATDTQ